MVMNTFYQWFLPFIISTINSLYIGFSHHQIIIFINFLSLMILLFIGLIIFRHLSLSFFLSLIYSVAIIITFIFLIMILHQSEILLRENYNFIPQGIFIMLQIVAYLAYGISYYGVLPFQSPFIFLIRHSLRTSYPQASFYLSSSYRLSSFRLGLFTSSLIIATFNQNPKKGEILITKFYLFWPTLALGNGLADL